MGQLSQPQRSQQFRGRSPPICFGPAAALVAGLALAAALAPAAALASTAPAPIKDDPGEQIPGPANPADPAAVAAWRSGLEAWRARMLAKIDYNGSIYEVPELKWTQTSYIQPQMHPCAY